MRKKGNMKYVLHRMYTCKCTCTFTYIHLQTYTCKYVLHRIYVQ